MSSSVNQHILRYVETLTKSMSNDVKRHFENTFKENLLQRISLKDFIDSNIPPSQYFNTLRHVLESTQNYLDNKNPQPVGLYWNPTIAATIDFSENLSRGCAPTRSSKVPDTSITSKQVKQRDCKPKKPDKPKSSSVTNNSSKEVKPKKLTPKQKGGTSTQDNPHSDQIEEPGEPDYEGLTKLLNSGVQLYSQKCHIHVSCTQPSCKFCISMFRYTRISACTVIHPNEPCCHASGYYPHIGKQFWFSMRKSHVAGLPFKVKQLGDLKSGTKYSLEEYMINTLVMKPPTTSVSSPNKRIRTIVDTDDLEDLDYEPVSPIYEPYELPTGPWNDELETSSDACQTDSTIME